jgi:hypothetical protein
VARIVGAVPLHSVQTGLRLPFDKVLTNRPLTS